VTGSVEVVMFDFDQTLGYYEPAHLELYVRAAAARGVEVSAEALAGAVDAAWGPWETEHGVDHSAHSGDEAAFNAVRAQLHVGRYEAAGVRGDPETMKAIATELCALEGEPVHFALYDDARPALERVRDAGAKALVVSNHIWRLPEVIEALGLGGLVESVVTSARVGYRKPHPAIFRAAMELAGGGDPESMVYVGDNYAHDVAGARAVGMRAVLIDRKGTSGRPEAIRSLMEVPL
jgi:putative hydrolase of the HAD superfamily